MISLDTAIVLFVTSLINGAANAFGMWAITRMVIKKIEQRSEQKAQEQIQK